MPDPGVLSADFCAGRLKAISDTTRWAVVEMLIGGPMTAGTIQLALGIDRAVVLDLGGSPDAGEFLIDLAPGIAHLRLRRGQRRMPRAERGDEIGLTRQRRAESFAAGDNAVHFASIVKRLRFF